jgi:hypothetical protein
MTRTHKLVLALDILIYLKVSYTAVTHHSYADMGLAIVIAILALTLGEAHKPKKEKGDR